MSTEPSENPSDDLTIGFGKIQKQQALNNDKNSPQCQQPIYSSALRNSTALLDLPAPMGKEKKKRHCEQKHRHR